MPHITASHLCTYLRCPHRIYRDAFDDPADKDPPNEFVQMLWEQGTQYQAEIIAAMSGEKDILDLSVVPVGEWATQTLKALSEGVPLIYHGRLQTEELLGEPDLLELLPDGEYRPVDIKSGMGLEGQDENKEGSYKFNETDELPGSHNTVGKCLYFAPLQLELGQAAWLSWPETSRKLT